ncbi:MAG: NAD-dependent epimerase/dehydratase family protein [Bacteroidales bacterium]|nr:NAD-dependent epimerase/dehydratase family protein [Bacteroidales bacterium]
MTFLVTGCAGFIGYYITKVLCNGKNLVIGIDNLNNYYDTNLKIGRLKELKNCADFTFYKLDLCDEEGMESLFKENKFDIVCHFAAQAGVRYSFENPQAYIDSNITGFDNIIKLSNKYHVKHFIYASSSSVYGNNKKTPFSEKDELEGQLSLYAETKRKNELEACKYSTDYGLCTTGLRFFTVYGPWGRPDMAPILFMGAISKGEKIRVFNNGNLWRDFTYIDDIVDGVLKIISCYPDKKKPAKIYNIGNSSPVNLIDFINILEDVIGIKAIKVLVPMQKGDVYTTYADTSLIEKEFGYKPSTTIKSGIKKLWEWYKVFYLSE